MSHRTWRGTAASYWASRWGESHVGAVVAALTGSVTVSGWRAIDGGLIDENKARHAGGLFLPYEAN
jgi:hypothetical protein